MSKINELATVEYDVQPRTIFRPPVHYPESDGEPMAETDTHRKQMMYLIDALEDYFRDDPNVYVAGNLFLYYQEGDPTKVVAPDVFVVKGVAKRDRRTYQLWKENDQGPDVVFELTSKSTQKEDLGAKKGTYQKLGVEEYFLFDPFGEYLEPRLMGLRLTRWGYHRIESEPMVSRVLGLELRVEGDFLRLVDPATGEKLLTFSEWHLAHQAEAQARRRAEIRAAEEAQARRQMEAELKQLQAELARLRGKTGHTFRPEPEENLNG
jgi:Uma2 family endonuclease